jgi:agmatinase
MLVFVYAASASYRNSAESTSKTYEIVDTQDADLDERKHTTPWFHAMNIPNVPVKNLVQIGIGAGSHHGPV